MDQAKKSIENGSSRCDEDPESQPLTSNNEQNARLSWDICQPKHVPQDNRKTPSLRDARRRSSATVWDLQKEKIPDGADIMVYKRRWIVLFVFILYALVGTYQWFMYAIISNIITKYYNISSLSVDFTGMSFLICYTVAFLPAGWFVNNMVRFSQFLCRNLCAVI